MISKTINKIFGLFNSIQSFCNFMLNAIYDIVLFCLKDLLRNKNIPKEIKKSFIEYVYELKKSTSNKTIDDILKKINITLTQEELKGLSKLYNEIYFLFSIFIITLALVVIGVYLLNNLSYELGIFALILGFMATPIILMLILLIMITKELLNSIEDCYFKFF